MSEQAGIALKAAEAGIHSSHDMQMNWNTPDPHNPSWDCRTCEELACSMCPLDDDDPLRETCIGYPWYEGKQVTGDDGITRTVRKSRTGWI